MKEVGFKQELCSKYIYPANTGLPRILGIFDSVQETCTAPQKVQLPLGEMGTMHLLSFKQLVSEGVLEEYYEILQYKPHLMSTK